MSIVLFAIIGATIKAVSAYWFCFGLYSAIKVAKAILDAINEKN